LLVKRVPLRTAGVAVFLLLAAGCRPAEDRSRSKPEELVDYVEVSDSEAARNAAPLPPMGPDEHGVYELSAIEEQPSLANAAAVQQAANSTYPPLLRDGGISGTVEVEFVVGANGMPIGYGVSQSSGYPQFDEAAARVVQVMRFHPAKVKGKPVPVHVTIPITYQLQ
jgi:TonB family protein